MHEKQNWDEQPTKIFFVQIWTMLGREIYWEDTQLKLITRPNQVPTASIQLIIGQSESSRESVGSES